VRNCVLFRSSSGEELITQDELTCCAVPAEDLRYTILLPHAPLPGTRFCAQEAIRETFFRGSEDPADWAVGVFFTNRVCGVMPTAGPAGQLPFTGSAHAVPLASLAALGIGVGAALLFLTTRRRERSQ
jgi:LPXTG cell wall anchor motif